MTQDDTPAERSIAADIDALIAAGSPMGDLGRFALDDLTAEEEAEFFAILAAL
jgi:hypothetical protein